MKMPIQLRWGGGLGAGVQAMQVIAAWARSEGGARDLRLPSAFASQENTRERFASTLPGMAALYFANSIHCDGVSFSRFKALESMVPRIMAMQSGAYRDTLRGQGAALCCFIGAKNEFLAPLYSRPSPGDVREISDFRILLHRILAQLSIREGAINEGQLDFLSGLVYQLFLNSDEHGSLDVSGNFYSYGVRGIAVRVLPVSDPTALTELAGDDSALKTYLVKQAFRDKRKNAEVEKGEYEPFRPMQLLEISVFDTGPGLGLHWLSKSIGRKSYAEIPHEEELEAVQTCFQKHATSRASQFKGQGLPMALMAMRSLNAFMTLRTGRLSLYQDLSRSDSAEFAPKNRFANLKRPAEIAGTSFSICFRVK
jgi:hypothetical protein